MVGNGKGHQMALCMGQVGVAINCQGRGGGFGSIKKKKEAQKG